MNWKPIYAILLFGSTFITWGCSILIEDADSVKKRKAYLLSSLIINFGILFLYKYYNFLNQSVYYLLEMLGIRWTVPNLDILLPVGISFYIFQAVGYTIDVYRGELKAERHLGIYALFVSFFPQLVAGPIERSKNLLSQFRVYHRFDIANIAAGSKQMIWGFFMKLVIADRLSLLVNAVYNNSDEHNGTTLLIATIFFAFQIYCDFAGYSIIAIGAAKMMGFELMTNFRRPYFSTNISDFWQRWHISLSTWFRDYLYIPLGGNRVGVVKNYFNIFVTFLISGIWHGANWTFVIWGGLHGMYNIIQKYFKLDKIQVDNSIFQKMGMIFLNFILVTFAWIFFRANTSSDAFKISYKILTSHGIPFKESITTYIYGIFGLVILLSKEVCDEYYPNKKILFDSEKPMIAAFAYAVLVCLILSIGVFDNSQFIYFQF